MRGHPRLSLQDRGSCKTWMAGSIPAKGCFWDNTVGGMRCAFPPYAARAGVPAVLISGLAVRVAVCRDRLDRAGPRVGRQPTQALVIGQVALHRLRFEIDPGQPL